MSLAPEDRDRKGRSRSRSRDHRPREEYDQYEEVREPSFIYPDDDLNDRYKGHPEAQASGALPYPEEGGIYSMLPGDKKLYAYDTGRPTYKSGSPTDESHYRTSHGKREDTGSGLLPGAFPDDDYRGKSKDDDHRLLRTEPHAPYENRRDDKYDGHRQDNQDHKEQEEDKLKFLPQKYIRKFVTGDRDSDSEKDKEKKERRTGKDKYVDDLAYGKPAVPKRPPSPHSDLAYGKAAGVPNTSVASQALTTYGGPPADDHHQDGHSEKHDDPHGNGHDFKHDPGYYGRYDGRYHDAKGEYRDDPRDDRRGDRWEEKRSSKYNDDYYDEREEEERRRTDKRSSRYDERYDDRYDERYHDERDERDRREEKRSSRYGAIDDRHPYIEDYDPRQRDERDERDPRRSHYDNPHASGHNVLTVEPGSRSKDKGKEKEREREKEKPRESRHHHRERSSSDLLTIDSGHKRSKSKSRDRSRGRSGDHQRDKSPGPDLLTVDSSGHRRRSRSRTGGSSSLGVATAAVAGLSVANAPASPLLESYHGTYQESSPMPSPLLLASKGGELEPLSPLGSDFEDGKKRGRRARFHDSDDISVQLAQALKGSKRPDPTPLIEILPGLTHEQVMELRVKYKQIVKTGPDRKGVNVAKHIRARLKDEDPLLMKVCYSVALGMWESEAYWANFWYQGDKTRRELLIESLMGRSNYEIHMIKESFQDKKYDNSLIKCMKTELKEDKFKKAVLMVLEERRMEEYDEYGRPIPLDYDLVDRDISELRRSIKSERGGETAMINIVVQRSDPHLREVLKTYEQLYESNFARDALKKSGNLVGELLAHILNGVINRPVRDALLLHHAITASRKDGLRRELLISRLVRYHWDPQHMRAVKQAYRDRYRKGLSEAVRESTSGDWGQFCLELCIARMPDDVRRFDKVAVSSY